MKRSTALLALAGVGIGIAALASGGRESSPRVDPSDPDNVEGLPSPPQWARAVPIPTPQPPPDAPPNVPPPNIARGRKNTVARTVGPNWYVYRAFDLPAWADRVVLRMWARVSQTPGRENVNRCHAWQWSATRAAGGLSNGVALPLVGTMAIVGCDDMQAIPAFKLDAVARVGIDGRSVRLEIRRQWDGEIAEEVFFDIACEYVATQAT